MSPSVVLVLSSGSYRAGAFVRAVLATGARLVLVTDAPQVLGPRAGLAQVRVDFADPRAGARRVAAALERPPDGVLAADEAGLALAARLAERFGCVHASRAAVAAAGDKIRQRIAWRAADLAQPAFRVVAPEPDAPSPVGVRFPCVVKPSRLSASQGVIRVDRAADLPAVLDRVRGIVAARCPELESLLIEDYVDGPEVALDGLVQGGRLATLALFDKPEPMPGPYFEETLLVHPSRLDPGVRAAVRRLAAEAVRAIGLLEGPVHVEMRIARGRPLLVEIAARSVGGRCAQMLRFGDGATLEHLLVEHALGRRPRVTPAGGASGALMVPIPRAGRLAEVAGRDAAAAVPGVTAVDIAVAPGDAIAPPPDGARYLGFVFARGADAARVEASLRAAWRCLEVRMAPPAVTSCSAGGTDRCRPDGRCGRSRR